MNSVDWTVRAIVEFKTHNARRPTKFEYAGKYFEDADKRRFEALFDLRDRIAKVQGSTPAIKYLVWGTRAIDEHAELKIDSIEYSDGAVRILTSEMLARPTFGEGSQVLFSALIADV
jgi:hypothetical protein